MISLVGTLLATSIALGLIALGIRSRRWFAGQPAEVQWWRGLLRLPRSFLVDVHAVVMRDPYAARMHGLVAGGFLATLALALLVYVVGLANDGLGWGLLVTLALMGVGAAMVAWRRISRPAGRLSRGAFKRLPFSLFAFVAFLAAAEMPLDGWYHATLVGVLGVWACLEMIALAPFGPMRHAVLGAMHLVCHPRFERFDSERPQTALEPLDLDAEKLGAEMPTDFTWNRLLSFDACVQCGRCQRACPAFGAGLPLNPKKLIQDICAASAVTGDDSAYQGEPHPGRTNGEGRGGRDEPLVGPVVDGEAMIHPDTLWSCTTCLACVHSCPMMIEHVDAIIALRRFETLERGATPAKAVALLDELRATDNPGGRPLASRLDWATDLEIPVITEGEPRDVLLWLGDGAFDLRGQRTLRALVRLMRRANIDFAVLGEAELDVGDIARRLGDEATFQDLARRNIDTLARFDFQRIVTADPHVLHSLRNEYPAFGGDYTVVHHSALLAGLLDTGTLEVTHPSSQRLTIHDPCYLGRYQGETAAPRTIMAAIGGDLVEMKRSGVFSRCCGGGGGAPVTDIVGEQRIPDTRMDDIRKVGAETVAVACPNCAVMLEGVTGPRPEVMDIAELLLDAVEGAS
jgi:Fe-S oxidoreductase